MNSVSRVRNIDNIIIAVNIDVHYPVNLTIVVRLSSLVASNLEAVLPLIRLIKDYWKVYWVKSDQLAS